MTGLEAEATVNIHSAKEVGHKILEVMTGEDVKHYSFKRKGQVVTMGLKIKRHDGTLQQVNPQELFHRLITMAQWSEKWL